MTAPRRALVLTSAGSSPDAVISVLAALDLSGLEVRALDVGRVGSRDTGTVERVMKAIASEFADRRLTRELEESPPDVAVAFEPGSTSLLAEVRDAAPRPAPVIAVVPELSPDPLWGATNADRYLTVDDRAAVALSDAGVPGDRILAIGPMGEIAFADAAQITRREARGKFKLPDGPVVLVEVEGLGYETTSQVALQLSLVEAPATYLFAAGSDVDAATALRRQVPTLQMSAKLFGNTANAPLLWRCADVVVARPKGKAVTRAMLVGARVVAFSPDDGQGRALAAGLEERGLGAIAGNALLISSALEPLLARGGDKRGESVVGKDGAANAADVLAVVAEQRADVLGERQDRARESTRSRVDSVYAAAQAAARTVAEPGELEDLSGGSFEDDSAGAPAGPDPEEISRLRIELGARMNRLQRTIADAQRRIRDWEKRSSARVGERQSREASRNADLERARMHQALAEMAQVQQELDRLAQAEAAPRPREAPARPSASAKRKGGGTTKNRGRSSVDDLLDEMKRGDGGTSSGKSSNRTTPKRSRVKNAVEDELAALKRKMAAKKRSRK